MLRLTASAYCLGVCLVGGAWAQAEETLRPPQVKPPAEGAVVLQVEGAVLTPSPEGAQIELKLEAAPKKEGEAVPQAEQGEPKPNPAPKGLKLTLQSPGAESRTKTSVTRTMSVIATTGIEDAEAKQELEALVDRLTKGADKLEAEGQKEAAVKKRAAADMLRNLTRPTPPKVGVFKSGTPEGQAKGVAGDVEVQMITIGTPGTDGGELEARIRELKARLAGAEKAGGADVEALKQKLKAEVEAMVQKTVGQQAKVFTFVEGGTEVGKPGAEAGARVLKEHRIGVDFDMEGLEQKLKAEVEATVRKMVGEQGQVFAFVESVDVSGDQPARVIPKGGKAGQPQVIITSKPQGGQGDLANRVAALEKASRMLKQTGNHEAAERLWDESQALKAKLGTGKAGQPDEKLIRTLRELQEQITDLRNEVRELKQRTGR